MKRKRKKQLEPKKKYNRAYEVYMKVTDRIKLIINDPDFREFAESQHGFVKKVTLDDNAYKVSITNFKGDAMVWSYSDFLEFENWYGLGNVDRDKSKEIN